MPVIILKKGKQKKEPKLFLQFSYTYLLKVLLHLFRGL